MPYYSAKRIEEYKASLVKKIQAARRIAWHSPEVAEELLDKAVAIILADWSRPIGEREDITGMSTRGTNKNFGNSGFAGGCTRLQARHLMSRGLFG